MEIFDPSFPERVAPKSVWGAGLSCRFPNIHTAPFRETDRAEK